MDKCIVNVILKMDLSKYLQKTNVLVLLEHINLDILVTIAAHNVNLENTMTVQCNIVKIVIVVFQIFNNQHVLMNNNVEI